MIAPTALRNIKLTAEITNITISIMSSIFPFGERSFGMAEL